MRVKSFLFIFYSLLLLNLTNSRATNRIATTEDVKIYGPYITPGDLIIDTPTRDKDGQREVVYFFMPKQWPGLREGATIWLDGERLGFLQQIKLSNTVKTIPWHIQSATIRNIPHTKVQTGAFVCNGLKNVELNGESDVFPGLSAWPESRRFLTGTFGFHVIHKMFGGHGIHITVPDHGTIRLTGFEVQFGFSGVRINAGDLDIIIDSIEISNFYIHDTGDGEGQYLGATHKPPLAKLKNLKIHDGIIARTAAEALQFQHLIGGADVHHITIRNADTRWINAFQPHQDTGIQWCVAAGENKLHHILLDGYSSVGLIPFGSDQMPSGGVSKISNILFNDGMDAGMYLHKSGSFGIHWIFDSLYYRGFNTCNHYYRLTGKREGNHIISARNGTDQYTFLKIFHDGSKEDVFENEKGLEPGDVIREKLPEPEYENSGFSEPANKIRQWHLYYGAYFPSSKTQGKIKTKWETGDIAIETEGPYSFYKCLTAHKSGALRPSENRFFVKLTWDINGVRSDRPEWKSNTLQSNFPPDDLRLKKGSYWEKLKIGFSLPLRRSPMTDFADERR